MKIIEKFATKSPCWKTNIYQQSISPNDPNADSRYQQFYKCKPKLMLHSVGCSRESADIQADRWNDENNNNAIAHAVIDSNDGNVRQTLRWDMRGWHCGNPGNNTHIGVEMCESAYIKYRTDKPWLFTISDKARAQKHCKTTYDSAVELFAFLCKKFGLNPMTDICSHKEGYAQGIASNHGDPEHYWAGLGMPYTMNGFRADVKSKMVTPSAPSVPSTPSNPPATTDIAVGDVVKIVGKNYYSGAVVPSWVLSKKWIVCSVKGDRVVVDNSEDGTASIRSPFHTSDLEKVGCAEKVEVGDLVKITGTTYYSGSKIPQWVLKQSWYVYFAMDGNNRVVINENEEKKCCIMSPINRSDLKIVKKH